MSRISLEFEVNQRFGKLIIIKKYEAPSKAKKWWCLCDCGSIVLIDGSALKRGNNKSCGCSRGKRIEC